MIKRPAKVETTASRENLLIVSNATRKVDNRTTEGRNRGTVRVTLRSVSELHDRHFRGVSPVVKRIGLGMARVGTKATRGVVPSDYSFIVSVHPARRCDGRRVLRRLRTVSEDRLGPHGLSGHSDTSQGSSPLGTATRTLKVTAFSSPAASS